MTPKKRMANYHTFVSIIDLRLCDLVLSVIHSSEGWFWKYSFAHSFTESLQISISKLNLYDSSRNSVIRFLSINGTKHYYHKI